MVHVDAEEWWTFDYGGRFGFDLWLVSSTTKDSSGAMPIVGQMQIVLDDHLSPGANLCRTATIGGSSWKACDETYSSFPLVIYFPAQTVVSVDLDLMPFILDFRANEGSAVLGTDYLPAVELGSQIYQGTMDTQLTDFSVAVVSQ